MTTNARLAATALGVMLAAGCASRPDFPPGVAGYQCEHRETTAGGTVNATAYPNYRGGYRFLSMTWEARHEAGVSPRASAVWLFGDDFKGVPGVLTVSSLPLDPVPPMHTKTRLQLSSGEALEEDFIEPGRWQASKDMEGRFDFVGTVFARDPAFIEKFAQAAWADISVVDPSGTILAQDRLDLAGVSEALARMRQLGDQVQSDITDYERRCYAMPDYDISEITHWMPPAPLP
jgi:hypothetical protein